ncbi:hypothetical protein [Effusibacillus dendaii]|uniref:Uncharacterized protein n=1 Tax=Effusibacillus dendaii TaxID=2743772 RepID=A0A7I8DAW0_9BACL|nr:hypothetical protein [Effusibacillus dendaii]BCJ86482.1 hypothetical protein skT53_14670 [Effusibacillus dendaii]
MSRLEEIKARFADAPIDMAYLIFRVERLEKALDDILYHYPTPIDIELDYEKAYSEIKEIAKRAKEESN